MDSKKAFILAFASASEDKLALAGRVLIDLKQGDMLKRSSAPISAENPQFIIEKMTACRKPLDQISAGMTCELITSGAGRSLKKTRSFMWRGSHSHKKRQAKFGLTLLV